MVGLSLIIDCLCFFFLSLLTTKMHNCPLFFLLFAWVWQSFLVSDPDTGWWPCLVPDLGTSLPMFLNPDTGLTWPRSKTLGFGMAVKFRFKFTKVAKAWVWHDPKLKFLDLIWPPDLKLLCLVSLLNPKRLNIRSLKYYVYSLYFLIFLKKY